MVHGMKFFLVTLFLLVVSVGFTSALEFANFTLSTSQFINLAENNTINISIMSNNLTQNVTEVKFMFWGGVASGSIPEVFLLGSNLTLNSSDNDVRNVTFSNVSWESGNVRITNLTFSNLSSSGIISAFVSRNFSFGVLARGMFTQGNFLAVNVTVTGVGGATSKNSSSFIFSPGFAFSGFVLNETGCSTCFQNYTNATIYAVTQGQGPPTITALASTISNASGYFRLENVNASSSISGFRLRLVYYNGTASSPGNATKVGTIMPDFPSFMFYGLKSEKGDMESFDMSLNKGTFYLQPAATLNFTATNGTSAIKFGYEVIDQALGYPIESNIMTSVTSASIVVPANRGYTVSFFRMPKFFGSSFGFSMDPAVCNNVTVGVDLMNDTHCPTPPKSYAIPNVNASQVLTFSQSLIVRKVDVHGCINPLVGANNTPVNLTTVLVKLVPWTTSTGSFVPPRSGDDGSLNITNPLQVNYTRPGCRFYYNFSLLNQTSYLLEFYAKNGTDESTNPGISAVSLAGFRNLTARDDYEVNVTLYALAGNYTVGGSTSVNTSMVKINIVNSTGGLVTTNVNSNIKIKNTLAGFGTLYYMIDGSTITGGVFYIPVLNNSNLVKAMVMSQNGPPKEVTLNLTATENNITIRSMNADKGFRKFKGNGTLEVVDTSTMPIQMRFLRIDDACDVPNAPSSCEITSMNASSFNPMKAMLAGKVNMEIKMTSTNVSLIFHDYDMLSAKQPPMESMLDEDASGRSNTGGTVKNQWNFGSFAPVDSYKNVTVVIPYSDDTSATTYLADSSQINVSIPVLYDENSNVVYNKSRGDISSNLSDEFIDYNNTAYAAFINNSNGPVMNSTDPYNIAYINTSANYLAITLPHFSTIGATVSGVGVATTSSSSDSTSSGGSGGTAITAIWKNTFAFDEQELATRGQVTQTLQSNERISVKVNGETHHVGALSVTATNAVVNVSSKSEQVTMNVGDSRNFELTDDNYYDLKVTLVGIVNIGGILRANVTVVPLHEQITSANTGTIPAVNSPDSETVLSSAPTQPENTPEVSSKVGTGVLLAIVIIMIVIVVGIWYFFFQNKNSLRWRVLIGQYSKDIKVH